MIRRWSPLLIWAPILAAAPVGCVHLDPRPRPEAPAGPPASGPTPRDGLVRPAAYRPEEETARPPDADGPKGRNEPPADSAPTAGATPAAPRLPATGAVPLPLDACIRRALDANATIRAARFNVLALRHRIPQVTALDDPVVSNTIFPIPSVAPQYSLMGYMPYSVLLAQQFPWFGTLRLRGCAAEQDVRIALYELATTQLDVVAAVKRAYFDLHFNERAEALLRDNRALAEDFLKLARERYRTATATQADVLRAEVALSDIDREIQTTLEAENEARVELMRLMHADPRCELRTAPDLPTGSVPAELERLFRLAIAARPDLQGRLAAVARDQTAVALARKRYYPNLTLGAVYQDMEKTNAETPRTASGMPNVGLFVGFNLPVYRGKIAAGVCEAQARASADAALYEAERDQSHRDIKDLFVQARVERNIIALLRRSNLPMARQVLEVTASDYRAGNAGVDFLSVVAAWRDLLQVELQVAQVEAELGKTLASLERAVGVQLNEHPPDPAALGRPPAVAPAPPAPEEPGLFRPGPKPPAESKPDARPAPDLAPAREGR